MDKAIKLIYNPLSGDRSFKNALDACTEVFQNAGHETHLCRATSRDSLESAIANMDSRYAKVVVAGGDGTVNLAVNALKRHNKAIPLGIIPAGTANDFASHIKMPKDPAAAARAIVSGKIMDTDLGFVNGKYFINVCSAGALTAAGQQVAGTKFKAVFGKIAYYLKGVGQLPNLEPITLRISTHYQTIEDKFLFFVAINSSGAGGFDKLSVDAKINDGLLDFIGFKAMNLLEAAAVFMKLFNGEYLSDPNIIFLREQKINIETSATNLDTDIDGEAGPEMPLSITCEPGALPLIVPS